MSEYEIKNINEACFIRCVFNPVRLLLRAGIVRPHHYDPRRIRWPVHVSANHIWRYLWNRPSQWFGVFRNGNYVRDVGTWLPRRWGFHILGIDVGQRG